MSDVLGVGRIVDEASEVIDQLDRPFKTRTVVEKIGRKTITDTWALSKLDILFLMLIGVWIVQALEHRLRTGESWAEHLDHLLAPFGVRMMIGDMLKKKTEDDNGNGDGSSGFINELSTVTGINLAGGASFTAIYLYGKEKGWW